jgi:hypothetical protein
MSWLSVSALMGCGQSTREKGDTQRETEQQQSGAFHLSRCRGWSPSPDAPALLVLTDGAKTDATLTRVDSKPQEMQTTDVRHTLTVPCRGRVGGFDKLTCASAFVGLVTSRRTRCQTCWTDYNAVSLSWVWCVARLLCSGGV